MKSEIPVALVVIASDNFTACSAFMEVRCSKIKWVSLD
jgi:hypothetical protein